MLASRTAAIALLFLLSIPQVLAQSIDVGVVDSRVDATHPDLIGRVDYPFGDRTDLNTAPRVAARGNPRMARVASARRCGARRWPGQESGAGVTAGDRLRAFSSVPIRSAKSKG